MLIVDPGVASEAAVKFAFKEDRPVQIGHAKVSIFSPISASEAESSVCGEERNHNTFNRREDLDVVIPKEQKAFFNESKSLNSDAISAIALSNRRRNIAISVQMAVLAVRQRLDILDESAPLLILQRLRLCKKFVSKTEGLVMRQLDEETMFCAQLAIAASTIFEAWHTTLGGEPQSLYVTSQCLTIHFCQDASSAFPTAQPTKARTA